MICLSGQRCVAHVLERFGAVGIFLTSHPLPPMTGQMTGAFPNSDIPNNDSRAKPRAYRRFNSGPLQESGLCLPCSLDCLWGFRTGAAGVRPHAGVWLLARILGPPSRPRRLRNALLK